MPHQLSLCPLPIPMLPFLLLLLLPCSSSVPLSSTADSGGRTQYLASNTSFTHLTVHSGTGEIYVGAVNQVLKLSTDMVLEASHVTGPLDNANKCYRPPSTCTCAPRVESSDNLNKLLLVDYNGDRLLACGTKLQGVCQFLRLDNLSNLREPPQGKQQYLCGALEEDWVAGVIVDEENLNSNTGSPKQVKGESRLFIGAAVKGKPQYFPSLSIRKLVSDVESPDMLSLVYEDEFVSSQCRIPLDTLTKYPDFDIHFVYAFSSRSFVYFVTLQLDIERTEKSAAGEKFYTSKIIRMCSNDYKLYSYMEIPLGCTKDGVEYRLVQAAYKQKAGKKLALALGLGEDDDVLFVVFSQGQQNQSNPPRETVLCLFTLHDINRAKTERIQSCYRGEGHLSVRWLLDKELRCINSPLHISEDFCGQDFNQPLGGLQVIQGHPLYVDCAPGMGAVLGFNYGEDTLVFVGTRSGKLKKLRVDGVSSAQNALLYETVTVEAGEPVLRDMAFSPDHHFIYVLSHKQVTRLPVESCGQHSVRSECLGSGDPHCGWCVLANKCSRRELCVESEEHFITKQDQCVDM